MTNEYSNITFVFTSGKLPGGLIGGMPPPSPFSADLLFEDVPSWQKGVKSKDLQVMSSKEEKHK